MSTTGVLLANGCRITHGEGATIKTPFPDVPLVMHELTSGDTSTNAPAYRGQFGFIPFTHELRLPRHVHLTADAGDAVRRRLLAERILVLNGTALTELNGAVFVVARGSLVDIAPGVPHTWTACPPGVRLPDGTVSDGQFLMVYEYSEPTGFFPVAETATLNDVDRWDPYAGDLETIRFPHLSARQVVEQACLVWNRELRAELHQA